MPVGKQIGQFEGHHTSITINYGYMGTKTAKTPWVGFIVTGLILYFINLILHFI